MAWASTPKKLAVTLEVLGRLQELDEEHPDFLTVRRATAQMFKSVKKARRLELRAQVAEADRSVVAATATGAADRIDDETRGIPLATSTTAPVAGTLLKSRACYICKKQYTQVDAFYHQLCPDCAAMSHAKRDARTDLTGRRALLTGGRAKIGMYIALRLLRDGAHTTITTRFPRDAVRRFSSLPDSADWLHRLRVVGIDLRDPAQVIGLADAVVAAGPLDILINNAAQTVRRSSGAYAPLAEAELAPLPDGPLPELLTFGHTGDAHPLALAASVGSHPILAALESTRRADRLTADALTAGSTSLERLASGTAIDAGGLVPDTHDANSWTQHVQEVEPLELLEVQLANMTAPFLLISRLRPAMAAAAARAKVCRQRLRDGGRVRAPVQGPGASAHQHGEGRAQHAHAHECGRDVRDRRHPHDERRHGLDHPTRGRTRPRSGSPRRASTPRSTWWMGPHGSMTRSCRAKPGSIFTESFSRISGVRTGSRARFRAYRRRFRRKTAKSGVMERRKHISSQ